MDLVNNKDEPNISGDILNIILLTYLYVLQCLPRGISDAISIVLQKRNVSYQDQAGFSLVSYSYCFKLLWSPIVDCMYWKRMGRRKTWAIPTQMLIGIFLLVISINLDDWLGSEDGTIKPKTGLLGLIFFSCVFFAATQDVAVDGWSLTMLRKENVGHSGTCNNVGFTISQVLGFVLPIVLASKEFCNKFRSEPQDQGFLTYSGYTFFWAVVFIVSSTLVLIFKKEEDVEDDECQLGIKESYMRLWQIMKIGPVQQLCLILFVYSVATAPLNGVARLKLIDAGVPSDSFALLTVPSLPFIIILPYVFERFLIGPIAIRTYMATYVFRIILSVVYTVFVFLIPYTKDVNDELTSWHFWMLLLLHTTNMVSESLLFIAQYAFFARISDPRFGGMYLTLFSAVGSIGFRWPVSVCLWLVDRLTIRSCSAFEEENECRVIFDGFFAETIICTLFGVFSFNWIRKKYYELEDLDVSKWIVGEKRTIIENSVLLSIEGVPK